MKKILNHIRKNWIRHGFETLVVTVGILGAFTLNNWNEDRKSGKVELKILEELYAVLKGGALEGELEFQKAQITQNKKSKASGELIIKHFDDNLPYHDSLKLHFGKAHTRYLGLIKAHAYQNAKNYGLGFIANDSLKELLTWTYETNSIWLTELNERNNLYENSTVIPVLTELFESIHMTDDDRDKFMIPIDYESLRDNSTYMNILKTTINRRNEFLLFQQRRYQRMLKLAEYLEEEIKKK